MGYLSNVWGFSSNFICWYAWATCGSENWFIASPKFSKWLSPGIDSDFSFASPKKKVGWSSKWLMGHLLCSFWPLRTCCISFSKSLTCRLKRMLIAVGASCSTNASFKAAIYPLWVLSLTSFVCTSNFDLSAILVWAWSLRCYRASCAWSAYNRLNQCVLT